MSSIKYQFICCIDINKFMNNKNIRLDVYRLNTEYFKASSNKTQTYSYSLNLFIKFKLTYF